MRRVILPPRVGGQLELWPVDPGHNVLNEPWGGRSPRDLTKGAKVVSLEALPPGGLRQGDNFGGPPAQLQRLRLEQPELPLEYGG